jgi:3',5'-cyclic AMP phosphodiesterase CpdA
VSSSDIGEVIYRINRTFSRPRRWLANLLAAGENRVLAVMGNHDNENFSPVANRSDVRRRPVELGLDHDERTASATRS